MAASTSNSNDDGKNNTKKSMKTTVCVIGGGPGAISFCHAVATQQESCSDQNNNTVPLSVTCFEQSSGPGGVWRSDDNERSNDDANDDDDKAPCMYGGLWTNGPSPALEFPDYSLAEHFGTDGGIPLYLPRALVLEYVMARVEGKHEHFWKQYFRFRHRVEHVQYEHGQFRVTVRDLSNNDSTTFVRYFDKCLWACGANGRAVVPSELRTVFQDFPGPVQHSSEPLPAEIMTMGKRSNTLEKPEEIDTLGDSSADDDAPADDDASADDDDDDDDTTKSNASGSHILLVGGGYSAEDLAHWAVVQPGIRQITVACRDTQAMVAHGYTLPYQQKSDKHESNNNNNKQKIINVYTGTAPLDCIVQGDDGDNDTNSQQQSTTVRLKRVGYPHWANGKYGEAFPKEEETADDDDDDFILVEDVDVVIFCTGYRVNYDMLDDALSQGIAKGYTHELKLPKDADEDMAQALEGWTPPSPADDPLAKFLSVTGDYDQQARGGRLCYNNLTCQPNYYRQCILIDNPNMMFLHSNASDFPLLSADCMAWYLASVCRGAVELPDQESMRRDVYRQCVQDEHTELPAVRFFQDQRYFEAVYAAYRSPEYRNNIDEFATEYDAAWALADEQLSMYDLRRMARLMQEGGYPASFGTYRQLNDLGRELHRMNWLDSRDPIGYHNLHHPEGCKGDNYGPDHSWRTFRDTSEKFAAQYSSLYTGQPCVPLCCRWEDIIVGAAKTRNPDGDGEDPVDSWCRRQFPNYDRCRSSHCSATNDKGSSKEVFDHRLGENPAHVDGIPFKGAMVVGIEAAEETASSSAYDTDSL